VVDSIDGAQRNPRCPAFAPVTPVTARPADGNRRLELSEQAKIMRSQALMNNIGPAVMSLKKAPMDQLSLVPAGAGARGCGRLSVPPMSRAERTASSWLWPGRGPGEHHDGHAHSS